MNRLLLNLVSGLAALAALTPLSVSAAGAPEQAPGWSLQTPGGETVNFPQDAEGRPTVLLFWPSWCPFSRALQPYVQDIWEDYRDWGVNVWTINIREDGDPVQTMKDRGLSFPLLIQGDALMATYHIERTPWLVVIDGDNNIVYTRPPHPPTPIDVAKDVRKTLNELLGDRAPPLPQSYPKPYDLHLKKRSDRVDRSAPKPVSSSVWGPWLQRYLADIPADETAEGIAPLGAIDSGKAAIAHAKAIWAKRYGEEAVLAQAPYRAYRDATRWVVLGDGGTGELGDGMILVVERETGRVIRVSGE
ncbi:MAG: redoxin domain-containing protein [Gammaproteobacteria bacterium]|nr:redoxin domain-containing protein [Gammaproteobacteria bacterium]